MIGDDRRFITQSRAGKNRVEKGRHPDGSEDGNSKTPFGLEGIGGDGDEDEEVGREFEARVPWSVRGGSYCQSVVLGEAEGTSGEQSSHPRFQANRKW